MDFKPCAIALVVVALLLHCSRLVTIVGAVVCLPVIVGVFFPIVAIAVVGSAIAATTTTTVVVVVVVGLVECLPRRRMTWVVVVAGRCLLTLLWMLRHWMPRH